MKMNLFLPLGILIFSGGVFALGPQVPAKSPKCARVRALVSPPNSSGVYFNETCDTAFVLPPAEAGVRVTAVSQTTNLLRCPAINARLKHANLLSDRIKAAIEALSRVAKKEDAPANGDPLQGNPFDDDNSNGGADFGGKSPEDVLRETYKLQDELFNSLNAISNVDGGSVVLTFNSRHQKLVEEYQRLNTGIQFVPMPLKAAALSIKPKKMFRAELLPGVIQASVAGVKFGGFEGEGKMLTETNGDETKRYEEEEKKYFSLSPWMGGRLELTIFAY
jgi:hypothetical protein